MKKTLVLGILLVFTAVTMIRLGSKAWSAAPQAVAHEGKGCTVPKEWGPLKGVADRSIAFEDPAGNVRIVDLGPCMRGETQLIVKIERP
jgi:hypothetical protein